MKKFKIFTLAVGFLALMFVGGSQFSYKDAGAYSSYSVESSARSEINWRLTGRDTALTSSDVEAIASGIAKALERYDQEKEREIKRAIEDALKSR